MTVKEKLLEEFGAAISAILVDDCDKEYDSNTSFTACDILSIAQKVCIYLDI